MRVRRNWIHQSSSRPAENQAWTQCLWFEISHTDHTQMANWKLRLNTLMHDPSPKILLALTFRRLSLPWILLCLQARRQCKAEILLKKMRQNHCKGRAWFPNETVQWMNLVPVSVRQVLCSIPSTGWFRFIRVCFIRNWPQLNPCCVLHA